MTKVKNVVRVYTNRYTCNFIKVKESNKTFICDIKMGRL